jgi:hypothetical protein
MCVSCKCGDPNNNYGDPRNITADMITVAAQAATQMRGEPIDATKVASNIASWGRKLKKHLDQKAGE